MPLTDRIQRVAVSSPVVRNALMIWKGDNCTYPEALEIALKGLGDQFDELKRLSLEKGFDFESSEEVLGFMPPFQQELVANCEIEIESKIEVMWEAVQSLISWLTIRMEREPPDPIHVKAPLLKME